MFTRLSLNQQSLKINLDIQETCFASLTKNQSLLARKIHFYLKFSALHYIVTVR
jgi:hypothetical protein